VNIEDAEVKLYPAGHLLGAAQILFFFNDLSVLYTGDISTDPMLSIPSAEIPEEDIDIVITEATYGNPNLFFEPRELIKLNIFKWIVKNLKEGIIPVINIGHLGPAQEVIAYINKMLSIDIYCNERMSKINEVYKKNGISLNYNKIPDGKAEFDPSNSVFLLSRGKTTAPSVLEDIKVARAIVTGQAARFSFSRFDKAFPFSMHANATELLAFIDKIKPKKVYTLYGFDSELAFFIRKKLRIHARPLRLAEKKLSLEDFL